VDAFSYLSVLLSIVLGLGLTQILAATGRLIRHRERVRAHWLPMLWAGLLLVIYVQVWWSMYGLRLRRDWTFLAFSTVLAQTATLYIMAAVVLPEQVEEGGVDLGEYYDRHHRWFFSFFLATLVVSVAKDVILAGHLPDATNLTFHAVLAAASISALVITRRRYHEWLGVACVGVIVAYIAVLFARLR
jgi:hypothetical protein